MLKFRKKSSDGLDAYGPLPRDIRIRTAELISAANRAEANMGPANSLEVTSANEVLAARELVAAQNALIHTMAVACSRGLTVARIRCELIDPTVECAVVGDIAWTMINTVLSTAANREGEGPRIEYHQAVNL